MDTSSRTVLVVGGDVDEVNALRAALAGAGYPTEAVATQVDAAQQLAAGNYACVIHGDAGNGGAEDRIAKEPEHSPAIASGAFKLTKESDQRLTGELERMIGLLDGVTRVTQTCLAHLNRDFECIWVNSVFVEKSGRSSETLLGSSIFGVLPCADMRAAFERVRLSLQRCEGKETPLIRPDLPDQGVTYWNWALSPVTDSLGELEGFDLSLWDVTTQVRSRQEMKRLRAENSALREASRGDLATSWIMDSIEKSEKRFRSVVQTAYDAIITMDSSGLITFWNYGAETMFGYTAEEAVGMPLTMIMPERYRRTHVAGLGRVVSTGKTRVVGHRVELNGLRKGGTEFPIEPVARRMAHRERTLFHRHNP